MITRVLVPMDDSENAGRALRYALDAHPDADVTVLSVVGEPSAMWGRAAGIALARDIEQAASDRAETVLQRAREIAAEHDRTIDTEIKLGTPVPAILDRAGAFDVVVLGSHSGTVRERLFVGNVAEKVVRCSPTPVTVVR